MFIGCKKVVEDVMVVDNEDQEEAEVSRRLEAEGD